MNHLRIQDIEPGTDFLRVVHSPISWLLISMEWLSRGIWLVGCSYIWPLFLGTTCHNNSALLLWLQWQTYCPTGRCEVLMCTASTEKKSPDSVGQLLDYFEHRRTPFGRVWTPSDNFRSVSDNFRSPTDHSSLCTLAGYSLNDKR